MTPNLNSLPLSQPLVRSQALVRDLGTRPLTRSSPPALGAGPHQSPPCSGALGFPSRRAGGLALCTSHPEAGRRWRWLIWSSARGTRPG